MTSAAQNQKLLRVGVIGLGGAAGQMIPKFHRNPRFQVVAAADVDAEILARFKKDFPEAETFSHAQGLCDSRNVDFVYIGTPNRFHEQHAMMAANGGKHVLVEKPMAVSIEEAKNMVEAADRNDVLLGVNVKHSFEPRVQKLREFTSTREYGELRMVHHWRYQDWLYRPRTGEELTPEWGGGILWRQGGHQIDLLRTIGLGRVHSVRGSAMVWDPARRVHGAHTAFMEFEGGAACTLVYSGHDHYDTNELVRGFKPGEFGNPDRYAGARRELQAHGNSAEWEAAAARAERYGGGRSTREEQEPALAPTGGWIIGGPLIASYDHADIKFSPQGLTIYGDDQITELPLLTRGEDGRDFRLNAFYDAITTKRPLECDGRWGMATVEVLLAIDQSGRTRKQVDLQYQVAYPE